MPNTDVNTTDLNATEALNVIDDLDMDLDTTVQKLLIPVYENYPALANTIFDIPLANLIAAVLVFLFFMVLREFFTFIVTTVLQRLAKYTNTYYDDRIISAL